MRLIACDLDGTVLDDQKRPDSKLKETIEKLKEKGIEFTFVSGRNEELLYGIIDEFELENPYVTNNGANIYQMHKCLHNDYIRSEYNDFLAGILYENGIAFRLFAEEGFYAYGDTAFFEKRMGILRKHGLKDYHPEDDFSRFHVYKITCDFTGNEDRIDPVAEEIARRCEDLNFLKAETGVYCANSKSANKGQALQKVCEIMGIKMKDVMAFGDNGNDLSMLEMAGISVAMGNSDEDIKAKCDYVAKDNNHDGVSSFLIDYFDL